MEYRLSHVLDNISNKLESLGCIKEAHDIDIISNTLERYGSNAIPKGLQGLAAVFTKGKNKS